MKDTEYKADPLSKQLEDDFEEIENKDTKPRAGPL